MFREFLINDSQTWAAVRILVYANLFRIMLIHELKAPLTVCYVRYFEWDRVHVCFFVEFRLLFRRFFYVKNHKTTRNLRPPHSEDFIVIDSFSGFIQYQFDNETTLILRQIFFRTRVFVLYFF